MTDPYQRWLRNQGGTIPDLTDPTNVDSVPAILTPGEFVMNKNASEMYAPVIEQMNQHGLQSRHAGNREVLGLPPQMSGAIPNPSNMRMPQGNAPIASVIQRDRNGNETEVRYDNTNVMSNFRENMMDFVPAMPSEMPDVPMPQELNWGGFAASLLGNLFSPDEERQNELAQIAQRQANYDGAMAQGDAFGQAQIPQMNAVDDGLARSQAGPQGSIPNGYEGYSQQDYLDEAMMPNSVASNTGYDIPTMNPHDGIGSNIGAVIENQLIDNQLAPTPGSDEAILKGSSQEQQVKLNELTSNLGDAIVKDIDHLSNIPNPNEVNVDTQPTNDVFSQIASHEGFRDKAYQDSAGVWTIGYGRTTNPDGSPIDPNQTTTIESEGPQFEARVNQDRNFVSNYGAENGYDWTPQQLDALTSFTYNLGPGGLDQLTAGGTRSNEEILAKIPEYNKAGGNFVQGLQNRRDEEAMMFSGGQSFGSADAYAEKNLRDDLTRSQNDWIPFNEFGPQGQIDLYNQSREGLVPSMNSQGSIPYSENPTVQGDDLLFAQDVPQGQPTFYPNAVGFNNDPTANPHLGITAGIPREVTEEYQGAIPDATPTRNPHEGITDGRANAEVDSLGNLTPVNQHRILSPERIEEINDKFISGKITKEQYDNLMGDNALATNQDTAFKIEEDRVLTNEQTNQNRIADEKLISQIDNLDSKIATAKAEGNDKLVTALETKKGNLQGNLSDQSEFKVEQATKDANDAKAKVEGAQTRLTQLTGADSSFTDLTPEQQSEIKTRVDTFLASTNEKDVVDKIPPSEKNTFKDAFKDAFSGLFGDGDIGSMLARGLILYAGGRLTGMSGAQALAYAGNDALSQGQKSADAKQAKLDAIQGRKDAVSSSFLETVDFSQQTPEALEAYYATGDTSGFTGSVRNNLELGAEISSSLNVAGVGKIPINKDAKGKGAYISAFNIRKVDPSYEGGNLTEQQFRNHFGQNMRIDSYSDEIHSPEKIREFYGSFAKGAVDKYNTQNKNFAEKKGEAKEVSINTDAVASDANRVYQEFLTDYPHIKPQVLKDYLTDGVDQYIADKNKFVNGLLDAEPQSVSAHIKSQLVKAEYKVPNNWITNSSPEKTLAVANSVDNAIVNETGFGVGSKEFRKDQKETWDELKTGWKAVMNDKTVRNQWFAIAGIDPKTGKPGKNFNGVDPFLLYSDASLGGPNAELAILHNEKLFKNKK